MCFHNLVIGYFICLLCFKESQRTSLTPIFLFFASSFVEHDGSTDRFSPSVDPPFSIPPSDLAVLHVDLPALVLHHWC